MRLPEKTFQVLDALDRKEISSQRQLADHSGISLGQVNYILKSLLKKGLVKVENFRKNPSKIGYAYLLTPKGIETKSRLAVMFILRKIREYDEIKERLTERLVWIEKTGNTRIIFIGPALIKELIVNLIEDNDLNLSLTANYTDMNALRRIDPSSFDVILRFDDVPDNIRHLNDASNIHRGKIVNLW